MHRFLMLVLLLAATAVNAGVYKWVDENGVVQYGDRPPEGAERVDLPPSSTYEPRELPAVEKDESGQAEDEAVIVPYSQVAITQPQDDETVRDNSGNVPLSVELEPPLQQGHRMAVVIDGRTIFDQLTGTQVTLTDVNRGTHSLQVKVLDADGVELAASSAVTFHMHRATVLRPPPVKAR